MQTKTQTKTVLLVGVGGQGTILAADILAKVAAQSGLKVTLSEIHGMAQRGGSVSTIVKFGEGEFSPVTDPGHVDALVSFELLEGLRAAHFLSKGGSFVVNDELIEPMLVRIGAQELSQDPTELLLDYGAQLIPAQQIAEEIGSPRSANIVLLGALSTSLPFEEELWLEVIKNRVPPKTIVGNILAFSRGRSHMQTTRSNSCQ